MYSVIINNQERNTFPTKEEAQAKAEEYKTTQAQVVYWPNKNLTPTIIGDNHKARIQYAIDNNLL